MLNSSFIQNLRLAVLRSFGWLIGVLLLTMPLACRQSAQVPTGSTMRVSVGEIKEVTVSSRLPMVGSSENQEVVDVSQKPMTSADSSALQQGTSVSMTFLIKGVTIGSARVTLSEKTPDDAATGPVRKAYMVRVVSK